MVRGVGWVGMCQRVLRYMTYVCMHMFCVLVYMLYQVVDRIDLPKQRRSSVGAHMNDDIRMY